MPRTTLRPRSSTKGSPLAAVALLLAAGLLSAALLPGCKGCTGEQEKQAKRPVVDCDRFCNKTFQTCGRDVFIVSGKLNVEAAMQFKVGRLLEKVKREGLESCFKACSKNEGRFAESAEINECLEIQDCRKYAHCITQYLK